MEDRVIILALSSDLYDEGMIVADIKENYYPKVEILAATSVPRESFHSDVAAEVKRLVENM